MPESTQEVRVPYRLSRRPRQGSLPVPYLAARLEDRFDFRIGDPRRIEHCMCERRCGLCGQTLERTMVFVGGPGIKEQRLTPEPPAHEECVRYALAVCPYLAGKRGRRTSDDERERLDLAQMENLYERRGDEAYLLWAESYRLVRREETGVVYYLASAWLKVERLSATEEEGA